MVLSMEVEIGFSISVAIPEHWMVFLMDLSDIWIFLAIVGFFDGIRNWFWYF